MTRSIVALGALLLVLAGPPAAAATSTAGLDPAGHESRIVTLVRAARGDAIARDWALMVAADQRAHQIVTAYCHCQAPASPYNWGEVIGWMPATWPGWERSLVAKWLASPDHQTVLLSRYYNVVGIGTVLRNGRWYVSVVFGRR